MKTGTTFWIVVGVVSVAVAGACTTVALLTDNGSVMWGLILMPILWASYKDHGGKKECNDED